MKKILLIILLATAGCTTALWRPDIQNEKISGIYLDESKNQLYAVGVSHGYVLEIDDKLERILILSRSLKFTPYLRNFKLSEDNLVEGNINLIFNTKFASTKQNEELIHLGFQPGLIEGIITYEAQLAGTRYQTVGAMDYQKLQKEILVGIALPYKGAGTARRLLLTRGSVATDAAVTVPAGLLIVLVMATDSL